jgi:hypothetical protein
MTFLPATPGLLISMSIRFDHAFGFDYESLLSGKPSNETVLETRQIKTIRLMKLFYDQVVSNKTFVATYDRATHKQLCEEMTGEGFYRPDREEIYKSSAKDGALREAIQLCTDKVIYTNGAPPLGDFKVEALKPETKGMEYSKTLFFD